MSSVRDILLVHHTHTDIGYTHYQANVFALQREYIRRAVHLAEKYADRPAGERFHWTCEVTVTVEDYLRHASAEEVERLQAVHRQGLIDFGGLYCNWSPLVTTELLAQSLLVAGRLRRAYGFDIPYALNCDVNGQAWGLVELLLDGGFRGLAMAINRVMARDPQPRPRGFWWEGPSGRRLLVWHGEHYGFAHRLGIPRVQTPRGWRYDLDAAYPLVQRYLDGLTAQGYPYNFAQLQPTSTFQWDNGGPHEELVRFVAEWNARGWQPRLCLVGLTELFGRLRAQSDLEVRRGDWTDWWAHGGASSAYETALTRQSHTRFGAARTLGTLLRGQPHPTEYPAADDEAAWRNLALYDEHTWGGFDSISHADSLNARGQWARKAVFAYDAAAATARLAQRVQHDLAARLDQPVEPTVCVFNSLPWARRVPLLLPRILPSGWEDAQLEYRLELASPASGAAARFDYGVVELPPCGYATLPLRPAAPEPVPEHITAEPMAAVRRPVFIPEAAPGLTTTRGVRATGWTLENQFYRLRVDPATGAIASLTSQGSGAEWVDTTTPWRLGHIVYETNRSPRGRLDMQMEFNPPYRRPDGDRQPELAPERRGPDRVLDMRFVPGVGQGRLALQLSAPGVAELVVEIVLYDDLPWIDLVYDIDKLSVAEPESVYIAFPLALDRPTPRYEVAGAIVEAEREQLVYATRDFYPLQHWVDVSDAARGVTIASPDAYMVHLGGFTNHKYLPHMPMEQPLVVGWPINNHWFTNFKLSQAGWMRFRYRLLPHDAPFDPVQATRFGAEAAVEPLVGPVWDRPAGLEERAFPFGPHLPPQASLLTVEPPNVHLVGMKMAEDDKGAMLRLQELAGRATSFHLRFPLSRLKSAQVVNLMEEAEAAGALKVSQASVTGHIGPRRLQSIRVVWDV